MRMLKDKISIFNTGLKMILEGCIKHEDFYVHWLRIIKILMFIQMMFKIVICVERYWTWNDHHVQIHGQKLDHYRPLPGPADIWTQDTHLTLRDTEIHSHWSDPYVRHFSMSPVSTSFVYIVVCLNWGARILHSGGIWFISITLQTSPTHWLLCWW